MRERVRVDIGLIDGNGLNGVDFLADSLTRAKFTIKFTETDGSKIERHLKIDPPGLIIVGDGVSEPVMPDLITEIRHRSGVGLIAIGEEFRDDKYISDIFSRGADDYIPRRRLTPRMLVARTSALFRRIVTADMSLGVKDGIISNGDLVIDSSQHEVTKAGNKIHLTPTEYALLEYLTTYAGFLVTYKELDYYVWGNENYGIDYNLTDSTDHIRIPIGRLRQKIETDPKNPIYIKTVYAIGWLSPRLEPTT